MCDATSTSKFEKVGNFFKLPDEQNVCVLNNNKFWFFGKKYVDQPTFNNGHYITSNGDVHATSVYASDSSWNIDTPTRLTEVAADENLNEIIFAFGARTFLFLYAAFGKIRSASLHEFDEDTRQWARNWDVKIFVPDNSLVDEDPNPRSLVLVNGAGQCGVYFIDRHSNIYHLKIPTTTKIMNNKITADFEYDSMSNEGAMFVHVGVFQPNNVGLRIQPTKAALIPINGYKDDCDGMIVAIGGVHGCGFMYQYDTLLRYRLENNSADAIMTKGEHPHFWSLSAHAGTFTAPNAWTFFGGMRRVGMMSSEFDGTVWTLQNVDGDTPAWQKCNVEIPSQFASSNFYFVPSTNSRKLFVFSENLGVWKRQF